MSNIDELLKLKELLDKEIITKEEFEQKKKELLNDKSNTERNKVDTSTNNSKKVNSSTSKGCLTAFILFFIIFGMFGMLVIEPSNNRVEKNIKVVENYINSYEELFAIIENCGFEEYTLERDELIDNTEGDGTIGFRIKTENSSIPMVFVKDGNIYCIKYNADTYLYKDGAIQHTLSEYIITSDERTNLILNTQNVINTILKSPSTAKFPSNDEWRVGKQDGKTIVQGYVDSQNSFGATIRSEFQVTYTNDIVTSLIFDGEEYIK